MDALPAPLSALMILGVGAVAAAMNVLAGGGSLLALPALIFLGLPDTTANGTLRLAVLVQTATAAWRYRREGELDLRPLRVLAPPVMLGATAGAWLGATIGESSMRTVLTWAMLGCAALLVVRPTRAAPPTPDQGRPWLAWPAMLLVGFYGGFVQAGVGLLLLSAMALLLGYDLRRANILKVALVFCYTPLAIALFATQGRVDWGAGLVLAVGQAGGAWLGAGLNLRRASGLIRLAVAGAVVLAVLKMWPSAGG